MGIPATVVEKAVEWAYRHLGALQICWICIVLTIAGAWFVTTRYARASDLVELRDQLVELKGDAIAKRVFDYRVRQCDTPAELRQEKRWLAEQIRVDVEKYEKVTRIQFHLPSCAEL